MSTQYPSGHSDDDIFELTDVIEEGIVDASSADVKFSPDGEDIDLTFEEELEELFSDADSKTTRPPASLPRSKPSPKPSVAPLVEDNLDDIFAEPDAASSDQEEVDFDALLEDMQVPAATGTKKPALPSGTKEDDPFADLDFSDLGIEDMELGLDATQTTSKAAPAPHSKPQKPQEDDFDLKIAETEPVRPQKQPTGSDQQDIDALLGDVDFADFADDDFNIDIDTEEQLVKKAPPTRTGASLVDHDDSEDEIVTPSTKPASTHAPDDLDADELLSDIDFSDLGDGLDDALVEDLDDALGQISDAHPALAADQDLDDAHPEDMSFVVNEGDLDLSGEGRSSSPPSAISETIDQHDIDAMDFSGLKPTPINTAHPLEDDDLEGLELGNLANELDDDLPDEFPESPAKRPAPSAGGQLGDTEAQAADFDLNGLDQLIDNLDLPDELEDEPVLETFVSAEASPTPPRKPSVVTADAMDENSLELDEHDLDDLDALLTQDFDDTEVLAASTASGLDQADTFEYDATDAFQDPALEPPDAVSSGLESIEPLTDRIQTPANSFNAAEDDFLIEDFPAVSPQGVSARMEEEVTFLPEEETQDLSQEAATPAQGPRLPTPAPAPDSGLLADSDLEQPASQQTLLAALADLRARVDALESSLDSHSSVPLDPTTRLDLLIEERFSASRAAMLHDLESHFQDNLDAALEAHTHTLQEKLHDDLDVMLRKAVANESTAIADDVHARIEESMARKHQEDLADLGADLEERLTGILQVDGPFMERLKQLLTPEIERIAGQLSPPTTHGVSEQVLETRFEAMRVDLENRLANELPKAAARIIREEIKVLTELMD